MWVQTFHKVNFKELRLNCVATGIGRKSGWLFQEIGRKRQRVGGTGCHKVHLELHPPVVESGYITLDTQLWLQALVEAHPAYRGNINAV